MINMNTNIFPEEQKFTEQVEELETIAKQLDLGIWVNSDFEFCVTTPLFVSGVYIGARLSKFSSTKFEEVKQYLERLIKRNELSKPK